MGGIVLVDVGLGYLQPPAVGCALTEERIGHAVVRFARSRIDSKGGHHEHSLLLVQPRYPLLAKGKVGTRGIGDGEHRLYIVRRIERHMVVDATDGGTIEQHGVLYH